MSIDPDYSTTNGDISTGDTITFRRSHFYLALALVMFVCGLAVGYLFWGQKDDDSVAQRDARVENKTPAGSMGQKYRVNYLFFLISIFVVIFCFDQFFLLFID